MVNADGRQSMKGQCFPVTRNIKDPLVRKASSQGSTPEGTQIQHLQPLTREQSYQLTNPGPRLQEATTSALPSVIRSNWFFGWQLPSKGMRSLPGRVSVYHLLLQVKHERHHLYCRQPCALSSLFTLKWPINDVPWYWSHIVRFLIGCWF